MTDRTRSQLLRSLRAGHWVLTGLAKRLAHDEWSPRHSSNRTLHTYLGAFGGEVINVSGWEDSDKEGRFYRQYFGAPTRYVVSNIRGERGMPAVAPAGSDFLYLDLEKPLDHDLCGAFDVAFSHTVAEHIFDPLQTFTTIAKLTRDVVIIVVPFSQGVHYSRSFGDYLRFTPLFLKRYFEERGFAVLLCTSNDQPFLPVYTVFIASRYPARYESEFATAPREYEPQLTGGRWGRRISSGLTAPK
jgi:hypothetical protein